MIAVISGTNREGSNTLKIARLIDSIYNGLHVESSLLNLRDLPPEIFLPDSYGDKPASFLHFSNTVLQASGLVVVTPEYNGGFPGVLKLFIDMLKFPESFQHKPVCFVGLSAGRWGALRPVEQLQQIFGYRNAHVYPEKTFLPGIQDLLGEDGRLKDPELEERLSKQATGFVAFIKSLSRP